MPSVFNPKTVSVGSTSLTDVLSINWSDNRPEVSGGADGDVYASVGGYGTGMVRGTITFRNPVQAEAAKGATGTLTATLQGIGSASDQTLTITDVVCGGTDNAVTRDAIANCTVPFIVESSDGTTDPITVA